MRLQTFAGALLLLACSGNESPQIRAIEAEQAHSNSTLCKNALSKSQQRLTLQSIDNTCGDTWCEGDFNFAFDHLVCNGATETCRLSLRLMPWDLEPGAAGFARTCQTQGFLGFASLVHTSGEYQQLQQPFYEELTECIGALEDALRSAVN